MTVTTEPAGRKRTATRAGHGAPARARLEEPGEEQRSRADRVARGKDARAVAPLESHAEFTPDASRDPVGLLLEQEKSRVPELVPVRHGRMLVSPFTFYRGAALPMAADLASTPTSGLRVQLCGDAHLSNFGAFASPARRLVFDVNDFDETLPGPFEWDVKRLAASLVVAGPRQRVQHEGAAARSCSRGPRPTARRCAASPISTSWTCGTRTWTSMTRSPGMRSQLKKKTVKATEKLVAKAHTNDSMKAQSKLTTVVDGRRRIISDPPLIEPIEDIFADEQTSRRCMTSSGRCWASTAHPAVRPQAPARITSRCCRWPAKWLGSAASAPAAGSC